MGGAAVEPHRPRCRGGHVSSPVSTSHRASGRSSRSSRWNIPTRTWIGRSRSVARTFGHCNWSGPTSVAAGHGRSGSMTVETRCQLRCSGRGAGLRTRSGGTAPCSAARARATSSWPSRGSTRRTVFRKSSESNGDTQASSRTPGTALMMSSGPLIPQYSVAPERRTTVFVHCDLMPSRLKASNCNSPDGNARRPGAAARRRPPRSGTWSGPRRSSASGGRPECRCNHAGSVTDAAMTW